MPVFVDHDERRRLVITVASHLIADAGLEAVTVRDVADAADCSTAIVSHYFKNKRELLLLTYHSSIEASQARCDQVLAADSDDLKGYVAELMPLDEPRLIEWKIWLAFWARAVADRQIADVQRTCVLRARESILGVLTRLDARGLLVTGLDLADEARRMLTTLMGLAVQVMFDPADWPAERQHALVDRDLHRLYRPRLAPAEAGQAEIALKGVAGGIRR